MDLAGIAASTTRYNFHSHTQFCDGRAPMADFAAHAVALGMEHYGFSPHSPVPIASPCNMKQADVEPYLAEVNRLKALYQGRIRLYAAMEVDYLGPQWNAACPFFRSLPLDYTISSVHFLPCPEAPDGFVDIDGRFERFKGYMERYFHNDIRHVVTSFYRRSIDMVTTGGFDLLGHPDKIGHNASHFRPGIEEEHWYCALADELIDAVVAAGIPVELNTKAYADHNHRLFPSPRLLRRLLDAGVSVIVNSDAHIPSLIDASRAQGLELISSLQKQ